MSRERPYHERFSHAGVPLFESRTRRGRVAGLEMAGADVVDDACRVDAVNAYRAMHSRQVTGPYAVLTLEHH